MDVEGVSEGLVELDPAVEVKVTHVFGVEECGGNGDQVVAVDDALVKKTLRGPDIDFRTNTADGSGDRRASDRGDDSDSGIAGEDADGPPPSWRSQVRPYDVAALYHSGAVSDASRAAAETMAGSCGSLR